MLAGNLERNQRAETLKLDQRSWLHGKQSFELTPENEIKVTVKRLASYREFKVPLSQIHSDPQRFKHFGGGALLGCCIFGILWLGSFVGALFIQDVGGRIALMFIGGFLWLIPLIACVSKALRLSVNSLAFAMQGGGALHLWFGKPNTSTFNDFCSELSRRIKEQSGYPGPGQAFSISAEIQKLAKLKETGILSDSEFERAKTKLIDSIGERQIGFKP